LVSADIVATNDDLSRVALYEMMSANIGADQGRKSARGKPKINRVGLTRRQCPHNGGRSTSKIVIQAVVSQMRTNSIIASRKIINGIKTIRVGIGVKSTAVILIESRNNCADLRKVKIVVEKAVLIQVGINKAFNTGLLRADFVAPKEENKNKEDKIIVFHIFDGCIINGNISLNEAIASIEFKYPKKKTPTKVQINRIIKNKN
jgi:hypothetical protein